MKVGQTWWGVIVLIVHLFIHSSPFLSSSLPRKKRELPVACDELAILQINAIDALQKVNFVDFAVIEVLKGFN